MFTLTRTLSLDGRGEKFWELWVNKFLIKN
jgi:hypothetical protein